MYYIYMIRCKGDSLYTGITTDVKRRFTEHSKKDEKGAKYTKSHTVEKVEAIWESSNRSYASKLEYNLKKLTKSQKEEIILNDENLTKYLGNKLDTNLYCRHQKL